MATYQYNDVESGVNNGLEDLKEPFVCQEKIVVYSDTTKSDAHGSIWMVLLTTFIVVSGSFEFGSCVSTSVRVSINLSSMEKALLSFFFLFSFLSHLLTKFSSLFLVSVPSYKRSQRSFFSLSNYFAGWIFSTNSICH